MNAVASSLHDSRPHAPHGVGRTVALMLRLLPALLALTLVGCRPGAQAGSGAAGGQGAGGEDLVARVLFTATGSFDAQSQDKARVPGGLRRAAWREKVPFDAQQVTIQYDSDARPMTWMLEIQGPGFTARDLAGPDARAVQTDQGPGLRPAAGSRLRDTVIITRSGDLKVLTRSYATQVEPALLGAFAKP
ncbi:hypothetical protein [Deinococcus knuensis]|uniref:Uncharacterized protein n=1 Tax=Deinococcus knuensis TaxID=1837380 RepID=A0ABQ2SFL5_9DEIO|nr:hypothetical protein [Deinococcus knuensis]GGS21124.1 hypothetical protein GCM10008961_10990 [Deinococcus knuensis]